MADDFQARFGGDAKGLDVTIQNVRKRLKELQTELLNSTNPATTIRLRNEAEKLRDALSAANKVGKTFGDTFKGQLAQLGAGFFAANKIISTFNKLVSDAIENSEELKKTTTRVDNAYKSFAGNVGDVVAGMDKQIGVSNDLIDSFALMSRAVSALNISAGDENSGLRKYIADIIKSVNPLTAAVSSVAGISRALGYGEIDVGDSGGRFDFSTINKKRKKAIDDAKETVKSAIELNEQLKQFRRVEAFPDTGFNPIAPNKGGLIPLDITSIRQEPVRAGGSELAGRVVEARQIRELQLIEEEGRAKAVTEYREAFSSIAGEFTNDIVAGLVYSTKPFKRNMIDVANAFLVKFGSSGLESLFKGSPVGLFGDVGKVLGKLFADGGYTGYGGVYEPAGVVHKGEVVWSQSDVAAVGGAHIADKMRPTYPNRSRGSGYASGGTVYSGNAASQAISNSNRGNVIIQPILMIDGEQFYGNLSAPNGGIERYTSRVVAS